MHKNSLAFSLVELLVITSISCAILIITLQALIHLYVSSKKIQHLLHVQNSSLVARYHLQFDIMHAGFTGCHHPNQTKNIVNNVAYSFDLNIKPYAVASICNTDGINCRNMVTSSIQQLLNSRIIPSDSPVLILYNVPQNVTNLASNMQYPNDALIINSTHMPHLNDILEIHDCQHADRFSISDIYKHKLQHTSPNNISRFSHTYLAGAQVFRPSIVAYYLRSTPKHKGRNYTLYRDDFQRNAVALVSGITNFKVNIDSNYTIQINLSFYEQFDTELICTPRNSKLGL